ncbi:MAG: hypothetical protein HQL39_15585 [Alphaproteobacteria bacterium]|nr:hypothetical protein [Alphaproteobacteria bacterium]
MTEQELAAWLSRTAVMPPNWLILAGTLAEVGEKGLWRGSAPTWGAWRDQAAAILGRSPGALRRMLACRRFLEDATELRRFVVSCPSGRSADPLGIGLVCRLPVYVIEMMARLKEVAPKRYGALLDREAAGEPITATRIRAAIAAEVRPSRRATAVVHGQAPGRLRGIDALDLAAAEAVLIDGPGGRGRPKTTVVVGFSGTEIRACELLVHDWPSNLDDDWLGQAQERFDRVWVAIPTALDLPAAEWSAMGDRLDLAGHAAVGLVQEVDGKLRVHRRATSAGTAAAMRSMVLRQALLGLHSSAWPPRHFPDGKAARPASPAPW